MNPKNARLRWSAGILLITALGLGIAIYLTTTAGPGNEGTSVSEAASKPMGHELQTNPAHGLPSPSAGNPALDFLLNRQRRRASSVQAIPNAPMDMNEPARAAEMPSDTIAPGSPVQLGHSEVKSNATENGPPGIPISAENLGRNAEALRNGPPATPTAPH